MRILPLLSTVSRPAPFAACFAAALLGGCLFETRTAGGAEDFPNTLASLGSGATESLADHPEWDQFGNIPALSLQGNDSLVAGPAPLAAAAGPASPEAFAHAAGAAVSAKRAAAAPDTVFDLADTATLGVGRRYVRDAGPLRVRADTLVFRWDDSARDAEPGNELMLEQRGVEAWRHSARLKAYRYENLDSAGGFDRAAFYERAPAGRDPEGADTAVDTLRHRLIVVKPGPDGDFGTPTDNRPVHSLTALTAGTDTLEAFALSDADGDGQLWGDGDSGLVEARRLQKDPRLRPAVSRLVQTLRAVFHREAARTYPVAFREARTDRDGRKVVFAIRGDRADSAFGPGDTVTVTVRTEPGPDEERRFLEKINRFRVLLAPEPGRFGGNRLLRFTLEVTWRPEAFPKGGLSTSRVTFIPDEPLAAGDLTLSGEIRIEAGFVDGTSASAQGRLAAKRIDVHLDELPAGGKPRRFRILWDAANGQALEHERLPD